jgi:predicted kinase
MQRSILVTGSSGLIDREVARHLAALEPAAIIHTAAARRHLRGEHS